MVSSHIYSLYPGAVCWWVLNSESEEVMAGELNGLKSEGVVYKYVNIKLSKNNNITITFIYSVMR